MAIPPSADQIRDAKRRLAPYLATTPLETLPEVSGLFLKGEHHQPTGSFKIRGALHKLLALTDTEKRAGIIAASSGNHGAAVAYASRLLGVHARVYVPHGASDAKVAKIREAGALVEYFGTDGLDTELEARAVAERGGATYISPYNDRDVIAGQGTTALELLTQLPSLTRVYVAVGGGGLIGGIGTYLAQAAPHVRVVGVLPVNSPVMYKSIQAGRIVDMPSLPTLSDGTAGGIEPEAITFDICREVVHEWAVVEEDEISAALRYWATLRSDRIEGAAGVAFAAYLREREALQNEVCCVVVCGGNIADARWRDTVGSL